MTNLLPSQIFQLINQLKLHQIRVVKSVRRMLGFSLLTVAHKFASILLKLIYSIKTQLMLINLFNMLMLMLT
jgi:hypothetical protein